MIAHWDDVESFRREVGHIGATWQDLGRAAGSVGVGLRRIRLAEGEIPTPAHVHQDAEEIFFVLAGSGLSWQDGKTFELGSGDTIVHHVSGAAHTLRGGAEGLDVLAFGERSRGYSALLPRAGVMWAFPSWIEVGKGDPPFEREAAAGPPHFPEPGARPPTIVASEAVERFEGGRGGSHYAGQDLGRAAGSVKTGLKLYELPPGKMGPPPHCHSAEEELFVVLGGEGTLLLIKASETRGTVPLEGWSEEHPVRGGHVVSRPAGTRVAHAFRAGGEGLSYLAYGTREPNDIAFYPRSQKTFFRGVGVMTRLEQLDYWDGEDSEF